MSDHDDEEVGEELDEASATAVAEQATAEVAGTRGPTLGAPLFELLLRLGDDRLILGHRMSEWCGHGPILEEDIAMSNIALDLIGSANNFLTLAGTVEGKGRDADALAFFREGTRFRNALITELPNGDFGFTMMRQFLFDAYSALLLEALSRASHEEMSAIAAKSLKEVRYHVRHSSEWIVRLGDGTTESHERVQRALDLLWRYTGELFDQDDIMRAVEADGVTIDLPTLRGQWNALISDVFTRATLEVPADGAMLRGGRVGRHTEHIGHLLADMQSVARAHPGASW